MRIMRTVGMLFGLGVMAGGLWLLLTNRLAPAVVFTLEGAVLVIGVVFERVTYKPIEPTTPGPGWARTAERFVDDASGRMVTVYVQAATGERKYVNE